MRALRLLLLLTSSIALVASAQQPVPLTEKIDVTLVNVDVTVTSRGEPVHGLTRDDFEVFDDGVRQPITSFDSVERTTPAAHGAIAAIPAQPADERFRRRVLVIVDNPRTSTIRRNLAIAKLDAFIDDQFRGGEYDWSIALVDRGARLLLPPTSDKAAVHAALDVIRRTKGYPPDSLVSDEYRNGGAVPRILPLDVGNAPKSEGSIDSRGQECRMGECDLAGTEAVVRSGESYHAVVDALRSFAAVSGKKIVLLLTSDATEVDFFGSNNGIVTGQSGWEGMRRRMSVLRLQNLMRDSLIHEANASNVNLYIINTEGLQESTHNSGLYWLARETGGRLMPGNDLGQSIQVFDDVSSNFYSLAYRQPRADDGKYHRIKVRLKKPGRFALQYRDGYSSIPTEVQMVRAMLTPLSASLQNISIPLSATAGDVRALNGGMVVPVELRIPLDHLQFTPDAKGWSAHVDLYVSIFDERGKNLSLTRYTTIANAPEASATGELIHNANVKLTNGKPHTIVFAVRDQTSDAVGMWRKSVHF
jgi:VWFA-related protein